MIPSVSLVRVFGSKSWYGIIKWNVTKLCSHSKEAMIFCYASKSKGYKQRVKKLDKFVVSRDVKFDRDCNNKISINAETNGMDI